MKKNGFTLIEIIAVIAILAVIMLISLPSLTSTIKKSEEKQYNNFLETLYIASENYITISSDSFSKLNNVDSSVFINVRDLINAGYIKHDLENPKVGAYVDPNSTIKITRNLDGTYSFKYLNGNATTDAYTQDHLIVHYDSYTRPELNGGSVIWPDISGNDNYATMQGTELESCYSNGAVVTNADNPYFSKELSSILTSTSDYTIEITYMAYGTADPTIVLASRSYGHWYLDVYTDGLVRTMTRNSENSVNNWPVATEPALAVQNVGNTVSLTNKYNGATIDFQYYGNGQALATTSSTGLYQSNTALVVGQDYSYSYINNAYIYSVRIYDKQLTSEEILNNYRIDEMRFFN